MGLGRRLPGGWQYPRPSSFFQGRRGFRFLPSPLAIATGLVTESLPNFLCTIAEAPTLMQGECGLTIYLSLLSLATCIRQSVIEYTTTGELYIATHLT
jgi:hypothetical protein